MISPELKAWCIAVLASAWTEWVFTSGISKHYETTLERVGDYYGIVTSLSDFRKIIELLKHIEDGTTDFYDMSNMRISAFLEKHKLLDIRAVKQSRVSRK